MPKKVYIGGVFDLFHVGHLKLLMRAAEYGDVYVGVLTDEAASRYKPRPIIPQEQRLEIIKSIRYVKDAFFQNDTDPTIHGEIQEVAPDILIHGDDWNRVGGQDYMESRNKETIFLPYTPEVSSSLLKIKLINSSITE